MTAEIDDFEHKTNSKIACHLLTSELSNVDFSGKGNVIFMKTRVASFYDFVFKKNLMVVVIKRWGGFLSVHLSEETLFSNRIPNLFL